MNEQIYARPANDGRWQWRIADGQQWQSEEYATGDEAALKDAIPSDTTPVHIILPGTEVIACDVNVDGIEKKHLAKMLPFELEDRVIDSIDNLHMAYGDVVDGQVNVHYIGKEKLGRIIAPLEEAGCEVVEAVADYALLSQEVDSLNIVYDGQMVFATIGTEKSFTVDPALASMVFKRLEFDLDTITKLSLIADSQGDLEKLTSWIPSSWEEDLDIFMSEGGFWGAITPSIKPHKLNLRSGNFARQLPFDRWFHLWKFPVAGLGIAFVIAIAVMFGQYLQAKSKSVEIRKQIQEVYLAAVPKGKKGDEERRLMTLLNNGKKTGGEPTNLMAILSTTADVMKGMDSVQLTNFRYNGDQRSLQINIEVANLNELNQFKEKLEAAGLEPDSPRSNAQGDIYQARMKVTEK